MAELKRNSNTKTSASAKGKAKAAPKARGKGAGKGQEQVYAILDNPDAPMVPKVEDDGLTPDRLSIPAHGRLEMEISSDLLGDFMAKFKVSDTRVMTGRAMLPVPAEKQESLRTAWCSRRAGF